MKLRIIAEMLSGHLLGDGEMEITGVSTLEDASPGQLSFLTNSKYIQAARSTKASAVIASPDCPELETSIIKHPNPYLAFAKAIEIFHKPPAKRAGIHPTAVIAETAVIGRDVSVGAYTVIGEHARIGDGADIRERCSIGDMAAVGEGTLIHSGVVVREGVQVGRRCIIQNNAVIGSDGFGYAKKDEGGWYKIYQAGTVIIEDDVEIGAGSTIDRATLGETRIGSGAKIDNLVQVGHGSTVGADTLLCAQVGLAGSTHVGRNVILAGQVGVAGHLTIGDGAMATGQTGIGGDIEPGSVISGSPAIPNKTWLKATATFSKLPQLHKSLRELEKRIQEIENALTVLHKM